MTFFFRPQRRSQVSVGFARTGSCFHHQRLAFFYRLGDGYRHLSLWFSRLKAWYRFRQLTVWCKIVRHTTPC